MRPLLAWIIICHWAVLFGVLAAMSALHPDQGPLAVFAVVGASVLHPLAAPLSPWMAALAAWAMMSTALMFAWALLSVAFSERGVLDDGVVSLAFASGVGLIGFGLLAGFLLPVEGHVLPLGIYLAALLASYFAIALPVSTSSLAGSPADRGVDSALAARLATLTGRPATQTHGHISELG